jgi:hypothetical protein
MAKGRALNAAQKINHACRFKNIPSNCIAEEAPCGRGIGVMQLTKNLMLNGICFAKNLGTTHKNSLFALVSYSHFCHIYQRKGERNAQR